MDDTKFAQEECVDDNKLAEDCMDYNKLAEECMDNSRPRRSAWTRRSVDERNMC